MISIEKDIFIGCAYTYAEINYCGKKFNKKMYINASKWTNHENIQCGRIIKPQGQKYNAV